jgi:hypothetical protein
MAPDSYHFPSGAVRNSIYKAESATRRRRDDSVDLH